MVKSIDDLATVELCPRCGARDQGESGFCDPCLADHAVEDYVSREAAAVAERREAWRGRSRFGVPVSDNAEMLRERQRRSRLLRQVKPREPAPPGADPYELANEALHHLARLRVQMIRNHERLLPDLEAAEELVRQLAWGPGPLGPERA